MTDPSPTAPALPANDRDSERTAAFQALRDRAEKLLQALEYDGLNSSHKDEIAALYQDLMVFHIELELQQDELLASRQQAESLAREHFAAFELAPLCYWKVDPRGMVWQWNLLGAERFRKPRQHLVPGKVPIGLIIHPDSHEKMNTLLARVFSQLQTARATVRDREGRPFILLARRLSLPNSAMALVAGVPAGDEEDGEIGS